MRKRSAIKLASIVTIAALLGSFSLRAQALQDVPRNRTLVVAFNAEAPNYRNVGLANPYALRPM